MVIQLLIDKPSPGVVGGVDVTESGGVIALTSAPGNGLQIDPIVDSIVREGCQPVLLDRVPQPKLSSDPVIKPVQDRQAICTLRRRRKAEQLPWREMLEQSAVRRGRSMVKLIDNHHVEVVSIEILQVGRVEALHRSEDMVKRLRTRAANP